MTKKGDHFWQKRFAVVFGHRIKMFNEIQQKIICKTFFPKNNNKKKCLKKKSHSPDPRAKNEIYKPHSGW